MYIRPCIVVVRTHRDRVEELAARRLTGHRRHDLVTAPPQRLRRDHRGTEDPLTEATVKVRVRDEARHEVAEGDGPVNALDNALRKSLEKFYPELKSMKLSDYKVRVLPGRPAARTRLRVEHPLIMISMVFLSSVIFSLAGFINAVFARKFDDISIIPTFVLTPLTYLGGVFYSISLLPEFWQKVSLANPILYMVNAFRYGILGTSDIDIRHAFVIVLLFVAGLVAGEPRRLVWSAVSLESLLALGYLIVQLSTQEAGDPVVRLDDSPRGAGIGLFAARHIARSMGGDLRVEAREPRGSQFVLDLPAAPG